MSGATTEEELQADMEAARLAHEAWLANRRHGYRRLRHETPSEFDSYRTEEDDRLDDPRHGQADSINRGR